MGYSDQALKLVQKVSADASCFANIRSDRRVEFADLLSLAVKQLDEIRIVDGASTIGVTTYRFRIPRRYFPRESIDELTAVVELARNFEAAISQLGDRTVRWFELETRHRSDLTLNTIQQVLQDFAGISECSLRRMSALQKYTTELERGDKCPRAVEVAAMMLYEAAVRAGGRLSTNKNSTDGGNPGTYRRYLETVQVLMPEEVQFKELSLGALYRLKTKADGIIRRQTFARP